MVYEEDENNIPGVAGGLVIFGFISIIIIFSSLMVLGVTNNYVSYELYNITKEMIGNGLVTSGFSSTVETLGSSTLQILPYMDYLWFISFISLIIGSLMFSYYAKRENFFGIFNFAVLGLIIFTYIGGIFFTLTEWFRTYILGAVFPTYTDYLPLFTWYLDNMIIINLIIIALCVLANYVHIDFVKFNQRKQGENIEEI